MKNFHELPQNPIDWTLSDLPFAIKKIMDDLQIIQERLGNQKEQKEPTIKGYLTVKQAAEFFQRPESTIKRWCRDGIIIGARKMGDWLIPNPPQLINNR